MGAVVRAPVTKAVHELQVSLPARNNEHFESCLAKSVIDWVHSEYNLRGYRRIEPDNEPLRIPYDQYGAAVGPRGRTIKDVLHNKARLVWSVSTRCTLDGLFEFWVPADEWSTAQEVRAKNAYASIEARAPHR